ncbi:MAG: FAD-dependent oxidoreductase [Gammaproteobacteria bacterium]|nr:FAD-dependent oxidoreductase [Gammaproteobacteria bacterium]
MTQTYSTDIVIFGGGVAGMWMLNRLRQQGFDAILLESKALGSGQTIASQGIIHGGLKYALSGTLKGTATATAQMPQRWRDCLDGKGDVDLRNCEVLHDNYYMWSDSGLRSKLKTFLGSKSLVGRVEAVSSNDFPPVFRAATVAGTLYKLPDFVINTTSLLRTLSSQHSNSIFKVDSKRVRFKTDADGNINCIAIASDDQNLYINCQRTIFCAGEGNQRLIDKAQLTTPKTQVRPLKMVYVKKPGLPQLYVHCIGDSFSLTPQLTVTSHTDANGVPVWYLGGELAEAGTKRDDAAQLAAAQKQVKSTFPWVDLTDALWNCFTINRAEPDIANNFRPDDAYLLEEKHVIVAWPTKLTLSPSLADKLISHLQKTAVSPMTHNNSYKLSRSLDAPTIVKSHWD